MNVYYGFAIPVFRRHITILVEHFFVSLFRYAGPKDMSLSGFSWDIVNGRSVFEYVLSYMAES
jgi:hypothetical protein